MVLVGLGYLVFEDYVLSDFSSVKSTRERLHTNRIVLGAQVSISRSLPFKQAITDKIIRLGSRSSQCSLLARVPCPSRRSRDCPVEVKSSDGLFSVG